MRQLAELYAPLPRTRLAALPTPLERGPELPKGGRLWVKRDDLTGLGLGGNKARKLEFLVGAAKAAGAKSLITVGAAQSNHCRVTAAAGAALGMGVHLVTSGVKPVRAEGNQLLDQLFGAQIHYVGCPPSHWGELEIVRESLTAELEAQGEAPYSIPIGGSTPIGALGYLLAYVEMIDQFDARGLDVPTIVVTSSSGGTHAGLVAGRALLRAMGRKPLPEILAVGVSQGVINGSPDIAELAAQTLTLLGYEPRHCETMVSDRDIELDGRWMGEAYGVPTPEADEAIVWGARNGGWVLDRVYSGKGLAGLLGAARAGRWRDGGDVVFVHTGGHPALFASGGMPPLDPGH